MTEVVQTVVTPRLFVMPRLVASLREKCEYTLGGACRYEWEFIPKGEIVGYRDDEKILAEEDLVQLTAFGANDD